jgi:hypothetical protein
MAAVRFPGFAVIPNLDVVALRMALRCWMAMFGLFGITPQVCYGWELKWSWNKGSKGGPQSHGTASSHQIPRSPVREPREIGPCLSRQTIHVSSFIDFPSASNLRWIRDPKIKDAEADVAKLSCGRVWKCGYTRYEDKQDKPSDFGDTRRPFNLTLRPWLGSLKHIDLINSWNGHSPDPKHGKMVVPEEKNGWNYSEF